MKAADTAQSVSRFVTGEMSETYPKQRATTGVVKAMEPLFSSVNPEERSGLGFAVMQSFMDKVKVISKPGKGTKVLLIKRLAQRE